MPRRTEVNPLCLKVGARVCELRQERGMSLQDLAFAGAMSKEHLSSIEQGLGAITIETIERIARALGVPSLCIITFPADDELNHLAELARKLPKGECRKLQKGLEARTTRERPT
ncbi:helix-turn-helix domain-containing protein [Polyangium jinanense]|uniref:Helix-turn-helix transcriptional regulator n=1 Tax=Polyangium jinanense TaxID=2829994 RepID=A0A9X3XF10_9BACT|nr:helix-turn-helix transcriptional regulator [Polyangium jinanense]MDC3961719.1 helix-turn-helix transcriptional regulator [Polyangium jinanense]MDC3988225.1 helix-turn-helix transcriptional regulator [Polyangium jinanense]